jgi:hypothetical protein
MTIARKNLIAALTGLAGGTIFALAIIAVMGAPEEAPTPKRHPPCDPRMVSDVIQQEEAFSISMSQDADGYPSIMLHPFPAGSVISLRNCEFNGMVNLPAKDGEGIPFTLRKFEPEAGQ